MMEVLTVIWALVKMLLILSTAATLILLIIVAFHPVCFNMRLRASRIGQRGELWCSYLFGMLKIGVVATPQNQDVFLKFLYWKKLLQHNGRSKPEKPHKPANPEPDDSKVPPPSSPIMQHDAHGGPGAADADADASVPSETKVHAHLESPFRSEKTPETSVTETREAEKTVISPEPDTTTKSAPAKLAELKEIEPKEKPENSQHAAEDDRLCVDSEPEDVVAKPVLQAAPAVDHQPLKPLQQVEAEQKAEKKAKSADPAKDTATARSSADGAAIDSWRHKLRRFKRDLSKRYRQLQGYIKLAMRKWKILSPVLKRFWSRGKKGFSIASPELMVRYALHEPYITGMFHGTMSVFSGLVSRFGINFIPVPVFTEPTIYARGCATAVIRPWRLLSAALGLLLEKQLYQEAWIAFKWYRANKRAA